MLVFILFAVAKHFPESNYMLFIPRQFHSRYLPHLRNCKYNQLSILGSQPVLIWFESRHKNKELLCYLALIHLCQHLLFFLNKASNTSVWIIHVYTCKLHVLHIGSLITGWLPRRCWELKIRGRKHKLLKKKWPLLKTFLNVESCIWY